MTIPRTPREKARVVFPKSVCEVPDASGFGVIMRVDGCFGCEKHYQNTELRMKRQFG
jgi:hypothetical protein